MADIAPTTNHEEEPMPEYDVMYIKKGRARATYALALKKALNGMARKGWRLVMRDPDGGGMLLIWRRQREPAAVSQGRRRVPPDAPDPTVEMTRATRALVNDLVRQSGDWGTHEKALLANLPKAVRTKCANIPAGTLAQHMESMRLFLSSHGATHDVPCQAMTIVACIVENVETMIRQNVS